LYAESVPCSSHKYGCLPSRYRVKSLSLFYKPLDAQSRERYDPLDERLK
jgi:hypothetical protein